MWVQSWVVAAPDEERASAVTRDLAAGWRPAEAGMPEVGPVRILTGPDTMALSDQYLDEIREIQQLVATTPREDLARRFRFVHQRPLGIPPRPGWVVAAPEGPRSPRPTDWSRPHGVRWVVTVTWPGAPPDLALPGDERS
ncbi:MAG: hypothetical protein ACP5QO_09810 [Clostridia bacterium]